VSRTIRLLATFRAACERWPDPITLRQLVRCNGHPIAGARISQSRITFVTKPSTSAITQTPPQITKLCCCFRLQTLKPAKAVFGRCFAFWNTVLSAEAQGTCH
jgi:hypothetical protein